MNKMPKMVVAVLATLFATTTFAQQSEPAVDPATMVALEKMGAYLRSLEAFRVKIITTNDTVLEDGQKNSV
jgi:hypothetical protein